MAIDIASIDATASELRLAVIAAGLATAVILIASGFWLEGSRVGVLRRRRG